MSEYSKLDFKEMYNCIHKNGNIYDGLAYLYSKNNEDKELNTYIISKINYDTNENSLDSKKKYAMYIIARNNFETKYKELLGLSSMFKVEKELLEIEEDILKQYPELNYNNENKTFNVIIDKEKIDNFFTIYRCYPENIIKKMESELFNQFGINITVGDENIEQIQKEMGNLGVSIYQTYYDWYKENGTYEYTDYIDSFCYGKINLIKGYLEEIIDYTEKSTSLSQEKKNGIIEQLNEYKNKLDEYERKKEEQEI